MNTTCVRDMQAQKDPSKKALQHKTRIRLGPALSPGEALASLPYPCQARWMNVGFGVREPIGPVTWGVHSGNHGTKNPRAPRSGTSFWFSVALRALRTW